MPTVSRRDPEALKQALQPWLHERMPGADEIQLLALRNASEGGSSETFFVEAVIRSGGAQHEARWVLRIEATVFQVYQDPSIERQFRVMDLLSRSGEVPVPQVIWYESDPRVLGAPFFLMERVEGALPDAFYHSRGLLFEASPAAREAMWLSAVESLARIHRVDIAPFKFLDRPHLGPTGLDQEIALWDEYARWSGIRMRPVQERARRWLEDNVPVERPTGLAWGDARLGNMIFRDNVCKAVIDWETASLGGAETDLGWWLFYDWLVSEGYGAWRLEGLGGPDRFIETWEHFAGRRAQAMEWHETFATFRFSMIRDRAVLLADQMGIEGMNWPQEGDPVLDRLAVLITQ